MVTPASMLARAVLAGALVVPSLAAGQVTAAPDQEALLASADPRLAANKRLVYDFWREVFEGASHGARRQVHGRVVHPAQPERADRPRRVRRVLRQGPQARADRARIKAPLVAIVAEGDHVVLSFVREGVDPKDPTKKYSTTWFDMFRLESGKIAEHWDPAQKQ